MSVASGVKVIPIISSGTAGPLGAVHLPRLWAKLTLGNHMALPEGHDYCGTGFDQMTINDLGLDREQVIQFVKTSKPTYIQFEAWVREHGKTDAETLRKHNASVLAYKHGDEKVAHMQQEIGLNDPGIRDAVTLNILEDLNDLHATIVQ